MEFKKMNKLSGVKMWRVLWAPNQVKLYLYIYIHTEENMYIHHRI